VDQLFSFVRLSHRRLLPSEKPDEMQDAIGLAWVRDHWFDAGKLLSQSEDLSTSFQAFDATTMAASISVAMMTLWGATERILSPAQSLPIDYEELTMGTDSSTNYHIFPNDRLVVPLNPNSRPAGNQSS
jgi:hypothetical protein